MTHREHRIFILQQRLSVGLIMMGTLLGAAAITSV